MKLTFNMERETKNTIRFNEVLANDTDIPVIGPLYVNKSVLRAMGWSQNKPLEVELTVKED